MMDWGGCAAPSGCAPSLRQLQAANCVFLWSLCVCEGEGCRRPSFRARLQAGSFVFPFLLVFMKAAL